MKLYKQIKWKFRKEIVDFEYYFSILCFLSTLFSSSWLKFRGNTMHPIVIGQQ